MDTYGKIVDKFSGWCYDEFSNTELDPERVILLINKKIIRFGTKNTCFIQDHFSPDIQAEYIVANKVLFLRSIEQFIITQELASILLNSPSFSLKEKVRVIPNVEIDGASRELADAILSVQVKQKVVVKYNSELEILRKGSNIDNKVIIVTNLIDSGNMQTKEICDLLLCLPEPYKNIAEMGKKPSLVYSENNWNLVNTLFKKQFISSFKQKDNIIRIFTRKK